MEPASSSGTTGNRQMKRWGPIVGVVAVVAIGGGVLVATQDSDKDSADTAASTTAVADTGATDSTTADTTPGVVTYPMSYSQAVEQGLEDTIDWGERCDTSTGRIATPDYFRPECYAPFEGDNGGATAPGVTADEITIVYYEAQEDDLVTNYITSAIAVDDTNADQFATMAEIVRYYETYYELYGRAINFVTYEATGESTDDVSARADAAAIAEQFHPFAVLNGPDFTSAFADELAAREILCIGCTPGQPPEFYSDRDPYIFGLDGSSIQKQTHVLEFLEKQIIGKNAEHGGDAVKDKPRVFGYVYLESSAASADLAANMSAGMEAMGAPFAETIAYELDPFTLQQTAALVISRMKAAGVTTIVFEGDPVAPRDFTTEATAQEYFPEWIVAASTLVDVTAFARTYDQEQWQHAFGVTQLAARINPVNAGYFANYVWFTGVEPPADDTIAIFAVYPALFFAVLQYTGPNLTAETFREALFASAGTIPAISAPFLTYGDKGYWGGVADYQGVDDATVFWWDATATGLDEIRREGTGMYQYVDGGKRFLPGEWPTAEKLFVIDGAVALYETAPPGEERGDYPSPAG
ncbi:MAG: hypothetical protein K8R99_00380 [Actinomycetia bacterium]|nr:hypothetical protein [Actinomycetes bacterium]